MIMIIYGFGLVLLIAEQPLTLTRFILISHAKVFIKVI